MYSYYGIFTWLPSLFKATMLLNHLNMYCLWFWPGLLSCCLVCWTLRSKNYAFIGFCALSAYFFGQADRALCFGVVWCHSLIWVHGVYLYTRTISGQHSCLWFGSAMGRIGGIVAPIVVTHMLKTGLITFLWCLLLFYLLGYFDIRWRDSREKTRVD